VSDLPRWRSVPCNRVGSGHSRRGRERVGPKGKTKGVTHASHIEGIGCHEMIRIRSCRSSILFGNIFESRRLDRRAMIGYDRKAARSIAVGFSISEKERSGESCRPLEWYLLVRHSAARQSLAPVIASRHVPLVESRRACLRPHFVDTATPANRWPGGQAPNPPPFVLERSPRCGSLRPCGRDAFISSDSSEVSGCSPSRPACAAVPTERHAHSDH